MQNMTTMKINSYIPLLVRRANQEKIKEVSLEDGKYS